MMISITRSILPKARALTNTHPLAFDHHSLYKPYTMLYVCNCTVPGRFNWISIYWSQTSSYFKYRLCTWSMEPTHLPIAPSSHPLLPQWTDDATSPHNSMKSWDAHRLVCLVRIAQELRFSAAAQWPDTSTKVQAVHLVWSHSFPFSHFGPFWHRVLWCVIPVQKFMLCIDVKANEPSCRGWFM